MFFSWFMQEMVGASSRVICFFAQPTISVCWFNYPVVILHNGSMKTWLLVALAKTQYTRDDEPRGAGISIIGGGGGRYSYIRVLPN